MFHENDVFNQTETHVQEESSLLHQTTHTTKGAQTTPAVRPFQYLHFFSVPFSSHLLKATVEVSATITAYIFARAIELFKQNNFDGFEGGSTPTEYIEESYRSNLNSMVKNYILHYLVIDFLLNEIAQQKINAVNQPRLSSIEMMPDQKIHYHFDISVADHLELKEWKHFIFKSPKRKKYKDLDKQVINFIENRSQQHKKNMSLQIEESDWICFEASMTNSTLSEHALLFSSFFWLRVSKQDIVEPFISHFINKEQGQMFHINTFQTMYPHQKYHNPSHDFAITIKMIVKGTLFSMDMFKSMFKLKNKAEVHNKLMEVFSYRNDISQRRAIIDEIFHLLLSKHRFEVPKHLVLRREEDIIASLSKQPDYQVYKAQKDFQSCIEMLAEKQLKEEIIIDQIAYSDNVRIDMHDTGNYVHLLNNKRLREFIYFKPDFEYIDEPSAPINASILAQSVLREKTLNHIIHTLTR